MSRAIFCFRSHTCFFLILIDLSLLPPARRTFNSIYSFVDRKGKIFFLPLQFDRKFHFEFCLQLDIQIYIYIYMYRFERKTHFCFRATRT